MTYQDKKEKPSDYGMNPGYPQQQIDTEGNSPSEKEVANAVKKMNPEPDSTDKRG